MSVSMNVNKSDKTLIKTGFYLNNVNLLVHPGAVFTQQNNPRHHKRNVFEAVRDSHER